MGFIEDFIKNGGAYGYLDDKMSRPMAVWDIDGWKRDLAVFVPWAMEYLLGEQGEFGTEETAKLLQLLGEKMTANAVRRAIGRGLIEKRTIRQKFDRGSWALKKILLPKSEVSRLLKEGCEYLNYDQSLALLQNGDSGRDCI